MNIENINKRDEANKNNLYKIIRLIKDLDYFLFFGTLLGDIRENNVIENDDDVDFLIKDSDVNILIKILKSNGFKVSGKKDFFVSFYNPKIRQSHTIDFYIYFLEGENIIIPTSIYGNNFFKLKRHRLILKNNLFFPYIKNKVGAKIPFQSNIIISKLYGKNWNQKLTKNKDYFIYFRNNQPRVTYNIFLIKFLYFIRLISELRFTKARRFLLSELKFYKKF